ncbi:HDOD domain-containing protein [Desulfovibrio sp. MES5]|uniref:HDOD domain-containing protein n=1 Tax=Desulfovibrio sp. MES5 TaxID=1899016 RepID=UPI0025C04B0F|nr:HDOD domain-containing protein [Desulfovibrio sp. MES5]
MQPQEDARACLQELQQKPPMLPFEPDLLPMLFAATKNSSATPAKGLVTLIERSQKLTTRVLATANSAAYGQEFKVSTLHRAINILGLKTIRTLVVMVGMAAVIKGANLPKSFDIKELWKHELATAAIAKILAAELGGLDGVWGPSADEKNRLLMDPDEAYIAGLLHDIGKVFFAACRPELWETMTNTCKECCRQYFEVENNYWSMDHALIGAVVLYQWKLPLILTEPINWHHSPDMAPTCKLEAQLLAAANIIARNPPDADGRLCEKAAAFLPENCDQTAIAAAIAQYFSTTETETFSTFDA